MGLAFLQAGAASTLQTYASQRGKRDQEGPGPWGRPSTFAVRQEGQAAPVADSEDDDSGDDDDGLDSLPSDHDEDDYEANDISSDEEEGDFDQSESE